MTLRDYDHTIMSAACNDTLIIIVWQKLTFGVLFPHWLPLLASTTIAVYDIHVHYTVVDLGLLEGGI